MQRYLVGGAVRDRLLGLAVKDRDFVVVGASPEQMLAQGFTAVGKDFPVFLDPQTHEEYALARTERKTAPGYRGFVFHAAPDVTLEQDLARRDLTVNAMAEAEDGSLIDPFGGQQDLQDRILRHVSPAFLEDPVRILRVARFAARFADFTVAPETVALMRSMVDSGEVDALVPERVWQEFSRGLMAPEPSRMITVLRACGALARMLPMLEALWAGPGVTGTLVAPTAGATMLAALDRAAGVQAELPVRLAILMQAMADTAAIESACNYLKVPVDCRDLALMAGREWHAIGSGATDPALVLALLERCDAFRKPQRFEQLLQAQALTGAMAPNDARLQGWTRALTAAQALDAGQIAAAVMLEHPGQPLRINHAVRAARLALITRTITDQTKKY